MFNLDIVSKNPTDFIRSLPKAIEKLKESAQRETGTGFDITARLFHNVYKREKGFTAFSEIRINKIKRLGAKIQGNESFNVSLVEGENYIHAPLNVIIVNAIRIVERELNQLKEMGFGLEKDEIIGKVESIILGHLESINIHSGFNVSASVEHTEITQVTITVI